MGGTEVVCGTCGTKPRSEARFCDGCGSAIADPAVAAEYKHVTVLFADVVRSMDLAARLDPERLRDIMAAVFNRSAGVVQRYGGTVDKFTGDGIMAIVRGASRSGGSRFSCLPVRLGHSTRDERAGRRSTQLRRRRVCGYVSG